MTTFLECFTKWINKKKSSPEIWASATILISIITVFFSVYSPLGINLFEPTEGTVFINRRIEDRNYFPARSPQFYLVEHFKIISPTLCVVLGFMVLLRLFGLKTIIKSLWDCLHYIVLLSALWLLIVFPVQFLIILLPLCSSYLFACLIDNRSGIIHKINIWFLMLWVQIILTSEGLSLIFSLNPAGFLLVSAGLLFTSIRYMPGAKLLIKQDLRNYRQLVHKLLDLAAHSPWVSLLISTVLFSLLWRLLLVLCVPPNNGDGLAYHLTRVAFWIQHESMNYFYEENIRINAFPRNSELLMLWTMISSKNDIFCGLIQYLSYLGSGSLLFLCLKEYFSSSKQSGLIIALLWMSLPGIVLQSTTVQCDLSVAYFLFFCFFYFLKGTNENSNIKLFLSSAALGIAMGTKVTSLFFMAPYLILVFCYFVQNPVRPLTKLWYGFIHGIIILIVSASTYLQNIIVFGNPFSPKWLIDISSVTEPSWDTFRSLLAQHLFNLITSQTGLQFYLSIFADHYNSWSAAIGNKIFEFLQIPVNLPGTYTKGGFHFNNWILKLKIHEDFSYYGPIGAFLIVLAFYFFFAGLIQIILRKKSFNSKFLIISFICIASISGISYKLVWDPWTSRTLLPVILLACPLLLTCLRITFPSENIFLKLLILYSILFLIPTTFMNERKPLVSYQSDIAGMLYRPLNRMEVLLTTKNIPAKITPLKRIDGVGWIKLTKNHNRLGNQYIQEPHDEYFLNIYQKIVPSGSRVGTLLQLWQRQYPYFGDGLDRTIVPILKETFQDNEFDFLLISSDFLKGDPEIARMIKKKYTQIVSVANVIGLRRGKILLFKLTK